MTRKPLLQVTVPPLPDASATYGTIKTIPIQIGNQGPHPVSIEAVTLHAQAEWEAAAAEVATTQQTPGFTVDPGAVVDREISFRVSPLCREATNYIDVLLTCREIGSVISEPTPLARTQATYLIIKVPPLGRHQAFISHKDPEDLPLAECLAKLAVRNGLKPYLARQDVRPGSHIWKAKIVPAIKASRAVVILCTQFTPLGPGVEREIRLARKLKKQLIPLLEKDAPVLEVFRIQKNLERVFFERGAPQVRFAEAIATVRRRKR